MEIWNDDWNRRKLFDSLPTVCKVAAIKDVYIVKYTFILHVTQVPKTLEHYSTRALNC